MQLVLFHLIMLLLPSDFLNSLKLTIEVFLLFHELVLNGLLFLFLFNFEDLQVVKLLLEVEIVILYFSLFVYLTICHLAIKLKFH